MQVVLYLRLRDRDLGVVGEILCVCMYVCVRVRY